MNSPSHNPHWLLLAFAGIAALFLAGCVSVPSEMASGQHSVSGIIASIDWTNRQITLKSVRNAPGLVLVWNDHTRFTKAVGCGAGSLKDVGCFSCGLAVGRRMNLYYRHEFGQNVLNEVRAPSAVLCIKRQS
jgi:hypothetical protein